MSVHAKPGDGVGIGIAYPIGFIADPRGPIETFRLVIGKSELEGRFICVDRRFRKLGDAAE